MQGGRSGENCGGQLARGWTLTQTQHIFKPTFTLIPSEGDITHTSKSTLVYINHPLSNTWEQHCCRRHILKLYRIIDGSGERICGGSKCTLVLVRQTLPRQVSTFVETGKNIGYLNLSLKQWSAICQTGGFSWIVALIPTSPPCSTTKWLPDFANNHWWSTKND